MADLEAVYELQKQIEELKKQNKELKKENHEIKEIFEDHDINISRTGDNNKMRKILYTYWSGLN